MAGEETEVGPQSSGGWLGELSRRAFLRRGTIGAAAVGVLGSVPGLSGLLTAGSSEVPEVGAGAAAETEAEAGSLSGPLIAHVKDLQTGEMSLFRGTQEIVVRDPDLARRLVAATRP